MHCPLCDAVNDDTADSCSVCGTSLTSNSFEESPPVKSRKWIYVSVFIVLSIFFILPWCLRQETFQTPLQVEKSRALYQTALNSYQGSKENWGKTKERIFSQVLDLTSPTQFHTQSSYHEEIPFEVLMAYLYEDLHWDDLSNPNAMIAPIYSSMNTASFLLSKKEDHRWPLTPYLSVVITIEKSESQPLKIDLHSLKRGQHALPINEAYQLFKNEFTTLQKLETFSQGLKIFHSQAKKNAPEPSIVPVTFSWEQSAFTKLPSFPSLPVR
jgi:hypothetical protein